MTNIAPPSLSDTYITNFYQFDKDATNIIKPTVFVNKVVKKSINPLPMYKKNSFNFKGLKKS
jgi:hypothetical protein